MRQTKFNLIMLLFYTGLLVTPIFAQINSSTKIITGVVKGSDTPLTGATIIKKGSQNGKSNYAKIFGFNRSH